MNINVLFQYRWHLSLVTVVAVFILHGIANVFFLSTWLDEGLYLLRSSLYATGKLSQYNNDYSGYMPLYFVIQGWVQKVFGPSLYAGRWLSFFITSIGLIFTYLLANRLAGGRTAGVVAVALIVFHLSVMQYLIVAEPPGLAAALLVIALYLLVIARDKEDKPQLGYVISAAVLLAIMVCVREQPLPAVAIILVYIGFTFGRRILLWALAAMSLTTLVILLPYYPHITKHLVSLPIVGKVLQTIGVTYLLPGLTEAIAACKGYAPLIDATWGNTPAVGLAFFWQHYFLYTVIFIGLLIYFGFVLGEKAVKQGVSPPVEWRVAMSSNAGITSLLAMIVLVTWLVNFVVAQGICPTCTVPYFIYVIFVVAAFMGIGVTWVIRQINVFPAKATVMTSVLLGMMITPLVTGSYFLDTINLKTWNVKNSVAERIYKTAERIKATTGEYDKIFVLGQDIHHAIFLANRLPYMPLTAAAYMTSACPDSKSLSTFGGLGGYRWNMQMGLQWLQEADFVLTQQAGYWGLFAQVAPDFVKQSQQIFQERYQLVEKVEDAWPQPLVILKRIK